MSPTGIGDPDCDKKAKSVSVLAHLVVWRKTDLHEGAVEQAFCVTAIRDYL